MSKVFFIILSALFIFVRGETSVYILSENLEQVMTSSTLQWVSSYSLNDSLLINAVVSAYQITDDQDNAEEHGNRKPVYVCRAKNNYMWVSGQFRPKKRACVVSLYRNISQHDNFEVLMNIEDSARLSWVYKDKYTTSTPQGGVINGEANLRNFVARRKAKSHNKPGSLTHYTGRFDPSEKLGVFHVVDQNNDELRFEDGEILVETEPIRYEIKAVKFDQFRARHHKKRRILGHAILKNTESGLQRVDTVISYNYTYMINWGKGHGLLTGLNFTVFLSNSTKSGNWALLKTKDVVETQTIETFLEEGTAVNVTLYGNYTESESPYTATVHALYKDEDEKDRLLSDTKREHWMADIFIEFGPVYFLHNNSQVPTTTSSTTTTTSTTSASTTKAKSTTHTVVSQDVSPQVVQIRNSAKWDDKDTSPPAQIHENSSMMSDASNAAAKAAPTSKTHSNKSNSSAQVISDMVLLGLVFIMTRRIT